MADTKIRPSTLVGLDRNLLYKEWAKDNPISGCEVGVHYGVNALSILEAMPKLHLILVDPYALYNRSEHGRHCKWKWHKGTMDKIRFTALKALCDYDVQWIMAPSVIAAQAVPDGSLDFVYIDGNHMFKYVMSDILAWEPKVKRGGIVSGHDIGNKDVYAAVTSYLNRRNIQFAITDKKVERYRRRRSWVYTRP